MCAHNARVQFARQGSVNRNWKKLFNNESGSVISITGELAPSNSFDNINQPKNTFMRSLRIFFHEIKTKGYDVIDVNEFNNDNDTYNNNNNNNNNNNEFPRLIRCALHNFFLSKLCLVLKPRVQHP